MSANGGCCKYGQICGLLECYNDSLTATSVSTVSGDSITGSEEGPIVEKTTVLYTNSIVTVTSTSTKTTAATPLITGSTATATRDIGSTSSFRTGGPITYLDPNRPGATSTDSAAGSRAKVERHWSWAVMIWWILAIIVEGV